MRLVLDTNVLISACLKPEGLESAVVGLVLSGTIEICVTPPVRAEYEDVLARSKFRQWRERATVLLTSLNSCALPFEPISTVSAAFDEDDNRFLECAEAGGADYLVTGNLRHYPELWGITQIVNARAFFGRHPEYTPPHISC